MARTGTTACLAALMVVWSPAWAAPPTKVIVTDHVAYGDLDLSTDRGARLMLQRMRAAAARVCAQPNSPLLPRAKAAAFRCRAETLAAAVDRLDARKVRTLHAKLGSP